MRREKKKALKNELRTQIKDAQSTTLFMMLHGSKASAEISKAADISDLYPSTLSC